MKQNKQYNTPFNTPLNARGKCRQTLTKMGKYLGTSGKQNIVIVFATIALFAIFTLINPSFASKGMLLTMSKALAPYAILALGVTFVIATGGIDLSIGTVCIGSAVLAGAICQTGVTQDEGTLWLTIPIILITGLVFGLINGFLVAKCKIAPFIATLGTMLVSRGLTAVVSEAVRETSSAVKYPATGWFQKIFTNYEGFPIGIVWVIVLLIICMVVMYKTKIGRYILAIGSNEEATRLSGINVDKYKIIAYAIAGFFAGLAALFYVASNPSLNIASGNGMELDAIAGVYIGGTSTTGGAASVAGTLLGSMILVVIRQGLNMALSGGSVVSATNITYAVTGVIVVGAVLLDVIKKKSANKVKIEKPAAKLKREIKERIAELKIEEDYALSAAKKNPEAAARAEAIKVEIRELKTRLNTEVPALKEWGAQSIFMTNEGVVNEVFPEVSDNAATYKDILFCGFDAGTNQYNWMKDNGQTYALLVGSVAQDSYSIGYRAVELVAKKLAGEKVEDVGIAGVWYNAANIDEQKDKNIFYMG